jgi:hypothetical protein
MCSLTTLTLVVLGAIGVLSRQYFLSLSTPTVWDEACAGWLAWALLCGGISLYHWKWRVDGHLSDVLALTSGGRWYGALSLLIVSAAGVAAQIVEGYSVFGFVPVSIFAFCGGFELTFWRATYHPSHCVRRLYNTAHERVFTSI